MTDLEKARQTINEVDRQMSELFEKRMDAVRTVAEYKRNAGLRIEDPSRESQVIAKNSELLKNADYKPYFVNFLKYNMELSKSYQHRLLDGMKIAINGDAGAFAGIVAKRIFPHGNTVSYPDFKSAYSAVENGECDCVLLPIENSFNGDVGQVMDLGFFGNLYISGIYEAEIVHNLVGVSGAKISDIKTVISHPQAFGQCASYIESHGFNTVAAENTAIAAKQVSEIGRSDTAAIASAEAAEHFGLTVLDSHINESSGNTTRFAVFSPVKRQPAPNDRQFVIVFTVKNTAGALGKAVSVIGEHGFNLRALKSRPTKELIWNYYFYAEGEGCIASEKGCKMLEELSKNCNDLRILGSFEKEIKI